MAATVVLTLTNAGDPKGCIEGAVGAFDEYFTSLQPDRVGLCMAERQVLSTFCAYLLGYGPNNPLKAAHDNDKEEDHC